MSGIQFEAVHFDLLTIQVRLRWHNLTDEQFWHFSRDENLQRILPYEQI